MPPATTDTFTDGNGNRLTVRCSGSNGTATAAPAALWQVDPTKSNVWAGSEVRVQFKLILGLATSEIRVRCANSVPTRA